MKKILLMLLVSISVFAQDVSVQPTAFFYHDTLTATVDTIDVAFSDYESFRAITISCYSDSTDTVTVYTKSLDDRIWTQKTLYNLSAIMDTSVAKIILAKTPNEFLINDPKIWKIRLISETGITYFTINAKKP